MQKAALGLKRLILWQSVRLLQESSPHKAPAAEGFILMYTTTSCNKTSLSIITVTPQTNMTNVGWYRILELKVVGSHVQNNRQAQNDFSVVLQITQPKTVNKQNNND